MSSADPTAKRGRCSILCAGLHYFAEKSGDDPATLGREVVRFDVTSFFKNRTHRYSLNILSVLSLPLFCLATRPWIILILLCLVAGIEGILVGVRELTPYAIQFADQSQQPLVVWLRLMPVSALLILLPLLLVTAVLPVKARWMRRSEGSLFAELAEQFGNCLVALLIALLRMLPLALFAGVASWLLGAKGFQLSDALKAWPVFLVAGTSIGVIAVLSLLQSVLGPIVSLGANFNAEQGVTSARLVIDRSLAAILILANIVTLAAFSLREAFTHPLVAPFIGGYQEIAVIASSVLLAWYAGCALTAIALSSLEGLSRDHLQTLRSTLPSIITTPAPTASASSSLAAMEEWADRRTRAISDDDLRLLLQLP